MRDLLMAVLHHLLVFALFGVLAAELMALRRDIDKAALKRLAAVDLGYGVLAGLVLVVGFSRAIYAAKGWAYYEHNLFFWAKLAAFALMGALSSYPTRCFMRWRKQQATPNEREIATVRRMLWLQLGLFAVVLACAAAMARGYGEFS